MHDARGPGRRREVTTVEGLAEGGEAGHLINRRCRDSQGFQCGFCTPGFMISDHELLHATLTPSDEDVVDMLGGRTAVCTGYETIVDSRQARRPAHAEPVSGEIVRRSATDSRDPRRPPRPSRATSAQAGPAHRGPGAAHRPQPSSSTTSVLPRDAPPAFVRCGCLMPTSVVDVSAALARPRSGRGCSRSDLEARTVRGRTRWSNLDAGRGRPGGAPLLATDKVRFVGKPVATVVAVSRYVAEDGSS